MSQSPYQPPTPYSQMPPDFDYYQPDVLVPARRAGALMYVVGILLVLSSFCCAGAGVAIIKQPDLFAQMQATPPQARDVLIEAAVGVVVGIGIIVLAGFTRRGSKGAIITMMVVSALFILLLLIGLLGVIPMLRALSGVQAGAALCMLSVPLALLALLMVWLVQAMRAADRAMASAYAMQYWQYAQQQAYGQMNPPIPPPPGAQPPVPPPPTAP